MKYLLVLLITFISFVAIPCCAVNKRLDKIDGLNDEIYYFLCGVWDTRKVIDEEEFDYALFTWGKGKFTQDSTIIDLGYKRTSDMWYDPPAIFRVGDSAKKILSVEIIDKNTIQLNLKGKFWDNLAKWEVEKEGYYTIHLNNDNTIWIDLHSEKKGEDIFDWSKIRFQKISGPKRPKSI